VKRFCFKQQIKDRDGDSAPQKHCLLNLLQKQIRKRLIGWSFQFLNLLLRISPSQKTEPSLCFKSMT